MNISDKALELIIRDVLSGMEELTIGQGYGACLENMEILAVEAAEGAASETPVAPSPVARKRWCWPSRVEGKPPESPRPCPGRGCFTFVTAVLYPF
jgi:hypothetical protein